MRLHTYYRTQQQALWDSGRRICAPFRVTPGMMAELQEEAGKPINSVSTVQGNHPLELIETNVRATGHNVILAPREDIFAENEDGAGGFQLVSLENNVTAVPDNLAVCEVVDAGPLAQNVRRGELVFIDFFEVKQGFVLSSGELYIAGCEAFKARWRGGVVEPLSNYVVTRHAPERFRVALTGTDRIHIPQYVTTSGIAGGKASTGATTTEVLYQEVVAVGPLTQRAFPGLTTPAERALLDHIERYHAYGIRNDEDVDRLVWAFVEERQRGRAPDIAPGDLVVFCRDLAQKLRVRGEHQHLVPYANVLAVIDDERILGAAIRAGKAGRISLAG